MPFMQTMQDVTSIAEVYARRPDRFGDWHRIPENLLRGPSEMSCEFRQLISCFVSGLNACEYCFGTNEKIAAAFGYSEDLVARLLADVETAPIEDRYKPILHFLRKLTSEPARMTQADADAILAAGWGEETISDVVAHGAMWNFINRMALGHGLDPLPEAASMTRAQEIIAKTREA